MGTIAAIALLLLAESEAGALVGKAASLATGVDRIWERIVLDPESVPDAEISELISAYDQASELYGKAAEIEESASYNGASATLARRLGKAYMIRMGREYEASRRKPPPPQAKPDPPEQPAPEEEKETPEEAPPPREERAPLTPPPEPEIPKEERTRGAQALRNFLMNVYFPNRRFPNLVARCQTCGGTGKVPTGVLDNRRRPVLATCGGCKGAGARLEVAAARKGYWLVWSPFRREVEGHRAEFERTLADWTADPGRIPEFLKSLSIERVDYFGLHGSAAWTEKGVRSGGKEGFVRRVEARFLRIGKRWYLYDDATDAAYLRGE